MKESCKIVLRMLVNVTPWVITQTRWLFLARNAPSIGVEIQNNSDFFVMHISLLVLGVY